ncbi:TonB-dependent siderophore receptor [Pseudomaricurvus alkylphenolicus]|uniref:TonB-dependent receptor n=1 Tax=Pseudomaricurvus alkylphenolicus TaxID=1306991 RepID=UPI00141FD63D|nr:TonB-dependent siderophore receptor [Pseudomaricurvus alkylphenolicus]NIB38743.1 TonB-dependent siderophore receptor [Pseudomaricurvus alkylphenolicus]
MSQRSVKKPKLLRSHFDTQIDLPKSALALGLSTVLGSATVIAQEEEETILLDRLSIEDRTIDSNPYAEPGAPYKAKFSGDKRRVKELADTPATISVLTQTQIKESGKTDLRDVLAAQPGITLGTGENGNAFGDRYIIRGHEARSDVFVDGLRDPGMTTRESFATEQIEITKGPSSTFAGRGSTGGAVNSITKQASTEYDFTKAEFGAGTDSYRRFTLDSNQKITEDLAVRVNFLHSYEEVPEREEADKARDGVALSATYKATDKLTLTADYYTLEAEDSPDMGTYIVSGGKPVKDIPVYLQKQDFLDSDVETFTFRASYQASDNLRVDNTTRYGTTDNGYVVTGARGDDREASDPIAPGAATIGLSTHQGWQDVEYFVNQTNIYFDTPLLGMQHQFLFSAEYSDLKVTNGVYNVENTGDSNCVAGRYTHCLLDGNGNPVANIDTLLGRNITRGDEDSDYQVKTTSLSIMDTITINDQWEVFAGIRADRFDYENVTDVWSRATGSWVQTPDVSFSYDDTIWNGHLGTVFKINEDANVYLTYSTSSNINGGESDVGSSCGYGGLCGDPDQVTNSDPESTENVELGTKWNLMDNKLLFTAAVFQITKKDVMESVGSSYETLGTLNTGKNRVKGFEIGLSGNITDKLSTQFGLTMMDSEVLDSFEPENEGERLGNFADDSAFLQLRYQLTDKLALGGTATYSSKMYAGQPDAAAGTSYEIPSYTVFDLFATYEFSDKLNARLNVGNVTDKDYYLASYRSGAFTYMGDARNAQLTVSYEF